MRLSSLLDSVKGHWPIVTVVSCSLASYGVIAFIHRDALDWYHHEIPTADFNFNPPFLGDVVFRTRHVPPANAAPYS